MIWTGFYTGLATQTSLIIAIGAQNNYVLRQGLRQEHLALVIGFCIISDIILAACAVFGLTPIVNTIPLAMIILKVVGIAFLLSYAFMSFRRVLKPQALPLSEKPALSTNRTTVWLSLIGFTWLNPHVWMDTIFLLGSVAQTQATEAKIPFMAGICLVSIIWFCALGYGARILKPLFSNPEAWKALDLITGSLMIFLTITLLLND